MTVFFRLFVLVLLLAGWALAAASLHVVRTSGKIIVIPKNRIHYADTYVDVTRWTPADLSAHPALVQRLLATGKGDVLDIEVAPAPATAPVGEPV